MKIGFVFDDSLDNPDGVQQYIFALSDYLKRTGHDVHFFVGETKRRDIKNIHSLSKNMRVKFNGNIVGTPLPASKKHIRTLLKKLHLDLIHVQLPYSPVLAGKVIREAAATDTAIIGTLHVFPKSSLEHHLNKLLTLINKRTLKKFDEIVAVSEVARQASHIDWQKINIIPNMVDLEKFQKATVKNPPKNIVFLGRLVERKGSLDLLKAVSLLHTQRTWPKNWRVTIGGGGNMQEKLMQYIDRHGLQDLVSLEGYVSEKDKPHFLANASIAVFPSHGGESFGISLLEAMAAGVPTLAGKNEGYSCVMTGTLSKQLFTPTNHQELADILMDLIKSQPKRKQITKHQNKHVQQFATATVGKQIEALYQNTLNHKQKMG